MYISRHVIFYENNFFSQNLSWENRISKALTSCDFSTTKNSSDWSQACTALVADSSFSTTRPEVPSLLKESGSHNHSPSSTSSMVESILGYQPATPVPTHSMATRSNSSIIKPNPRYALAYQAVVIEEPTSVKQALQDIG